MENISGIGYQKDLLDEYSRYLLYCLEIPNYFDLEYQHLFNYFINGNNFSLVRTLDMPNFFSKFLQ